MTTRSTAICALAGVSLIALSAIAGSSPRLVYNPSGSAPRGFYLIDDLGDVRVGDYVIARLPNTVAEAAAQRGYLPRSVPVLKQVAAMAGQIVCIRGSTVFIDAIAVARTLEHDGRDRPMHAWKQCRRLVSGEVFLLNSGSAASFDSRYFGPVDISFLRGRATLW